MIWLTWRQFRVQALIAVCVLAAFAVYLLFLGLSIRDFHDSQFMSCQATGCEAAARRMESEYKTQLTLVGALLIGIPAIIGAFWGAPLVTRELEAGTHRLVWNQSITRVRWLLPKAAVIGLTSVAVTGLFSLLLTWAASPYDEVMGTRFTKLVFDARNLAPLGYALFGFALGMTAGLLLRRTLPAMAVTLVAFAAVQIAVPYLVRPHLVPPRTTSVAVDGQSLPRVGSFLLEGPPGATGEVTNSSTLRVEDYVMPGALVLTSSSTILTAKGTPAVTNKQVSDCLEPAQATLGESGACLAKQDLHFDVTYQPASRYWTFQWFETAVFTVLTLLLGAFCVRRIPRLD